MRDVLESAFRCNVFDAYSGIEGCCLASECEYHKMHISPDVGIVELINEKGEPAKPGELAEIVATGLLNFAQPLIRYRTRDLCVLMDEKCLCGRNMPIIDGIEGRLEDTLIGPGGSEMISHGFLGGIEHIRESQIIQYTPFQFTIKIVIDQEFNSLDREAIRRKFFERLGNVTVTIEIVDSIEKTMGGKFRAVISYVERHD
jgi:phenylacetate-CoA ligase